MWGPPHCRKAEGDSAARHGALSALSANNPGQSEGGQRLRS